MAQLRYVDDTGQLQSIELELERITLGRASTCDIVLIDELISREHARLTRQPGGRWLISDLGSRNKTYVNGQAITERLLSPGDVLRLGTKALEFVDEQAPTGLSRDIDFFIADREPPAGTAWTKLSQPIALPPDQLERLVGVVEVDAFADSPEPIADLALAQLMARLEADRGFVAIRAEDRRSLRLLASQSLGAPATASPAKPVSQSFVYAAHLQDVAGLYPADRRAPRPDQSLPATAMVAPLRSGGKTLGVIYLDRPQAKRRFEPADLQLLMVAGVQLGAAIGQLHRRLAAAQQAEASARLAVIRRQQAAINAITTDRTQAIAAAARILPGQERCGDLYTVQALDEHRLLAAAADAGAMGTAGIIQATAMLNALSTAAALAGPRTELGQILTAMNRSTAGRADRQPIPLVAVWIDLVAGRISYVNAGHAAPLLLAGPARLVTLEQTALLPGADPETIYKSASADLPARFRLILVSDGLIEAPDKAGQAFGQERLHEALLSEAAFGQPGQIIELLASALAGHLQDTPQLDDAMIIALAKDSKSS